MRSGHSPFSSITLSFLITYVVVAIHDEPLLKIELITRGNSVVNVPGRRGRRNVYLNFPQLPPQVLDVIVKNPSLLMCGSHKVRNNKWKF